VSSSRVTVRSLDNPVVKVAIAVPSVSAFVYVVAAGRVADVELFATTLIAAFVLAGVAILQPWRARGSRGAERTWQVLAGTVGVGMGAPFLVAAVEVDVELFSLLFAIVLVMGAYSYPRRLRVPLCLWVLVVWAVTLWWGGVDAPAVLALHLGGGALVLGTSLRTADALAEAARIERTTRAEAEQRAQLLASVLRTNSLEPDDVLEAVTTGLTEAGFDVVAIRTLDPELHTLRLVKGSPGLARLGLPPELPVERAGLSGVAVEAGTPVVVDDYADHPAALPGEQVLRGVIVVPVGDRTDVRAVVLGGCCEGPVTPVQREVVVLLAEQAGLALARAGAFDADRRTVEQLRMLDTRTHDFVSTVSHELRTPLTVIEGLGRTLSRRWEDLDPARCEDLLRRIEANAERLSEMVRSLLDTSALEEGRLDLRPAPVPVRAAVLGLLDRLATVTVAHPVEVAIAGDLEVLADPGLFEHVIENLLTNVAKHTPQGTRVRLSAEPVGRRVVIEVVDEGPGIAPEDLPHVLERFYRGGAPTRRTSSGLGLGLALARQVVRAHGGELLVASEPEQGTRFRWDLPAVHRSAVNGEARPSSGSHRTPGSPGGPG
jgi:signal transduction histidine kinase